MLAEEPQAKNKLPDEERGGKQEGAYYNVCSNVLYFEKVPDGRQ